MPTRSDLSPPSNGPGDAQWYVCLGLVVADAAFVVAATPKLNVFGDTENVTAGEDAGGVLLGWSVTQIILQIVVIAYLAGSQCCHCC